MDASGLPSDSSSSTSSAVGSTQRGVRVPSSAARVAAYFRSGWVFFVPYLFAYLLYSECRWPANPPAPSVPPLLYVFWALHLTNCALALGTFRSWWLGHFNPEDAAGIYPRLASIAPWILLGLVLLIPGVYLEWPADPWEHFRRITEWRLRHDVGGQYDGYKSMYFFAYSLVGRLPVSIQLTALDAYSTGAGLLLLWQYYRLALAVGLDRRWAFLSCIVNLLTFGNVTFSFYRYYGLATTMIAQVGAVALTRMTLEWAQSRNPFNARAVFGLMIPGILLLGLIAFDHIQGLGIAALGIAGVAIWRLVAWKRISLVWVASAAILGSAAMVAVYPRDSLLDSVYRQSGWLNSWYGFNILAWPSPAADRALQILGCFGVANIAAAAFLLRRNQVCAWLTLAPVASLLIPIFTIPFAEAYARTNPSDILTYHRMLFAIPPGLATLVLFKELAGRVSDPAAANGPFRRLVASQGAFALYLCALAAAMTVPGSAFAYNRTWQLLSSVPADLTLNQIWRGVARFDEIPEARDSREVVSTSIPGFLFDVQHAGPNLQRGRHYLMSHRTPSDDVTDAERVLSNPTAWPRSAAFLPDYRSFYSPRSLAGYLSGHWPPQEAALASSGSEELAELCRNEGLQLEIVPGATVFTPPSTVGK